MAFIRRKASTGGHVLYQVVRSQRVDGKVRQQVLRSLGRAPTIGELIAHYERYIQTQEQRGDKPELPLRHRLRGSCCRVLTS